MKKLLYLFLFLPLIFSSCKKEEGCKDSAATNYNADAEEDDGSCLYSIIGLWNVDDMIIGGISYFDPTFSPYITNATFNFFVTNNYSSFVQYNDGQIINASGTWTVIGTSTLSLFDGSQQDFTITKLNGSKMELYDSDLDGMGAATLKLSK